MIKYNPKLVHLKKELAQYGLGYDAIQTIFNRIEPQLELLTKKEITKLIEELKELIGPFENLDRLK